MRPRRILSVLGPAVALAALVGGSVPWPLDLPGAAAFVDRGLREAYGISLTTGARAEVSLLPLPRIGFRDVTLRIEGESGDGPVLARDGSLGLQLGLAALLLGRAEVVSLTLDHARITLPKGVSGGLPFKRLAETLAGGTHPRRIVLSHATVTGADPRDGRSETARDVELSATWPLWSGSLDLAGSFTWNGASARFALSDLRPDRLIDGRESPFIASLAWPSGSFAADGTGRFDARESGGVTLAGQASLRTRSLPETLAWIGSDLALSPLIEAFAVEGRFEAAGGTFSLPAMRVSLGDTVLEGAGSAELAGRRPSLRATLDAHEINLGPALAGLLRIVGPDDGAEDRQGGWGRHSLALRPLTGGDLDLRLSGDRARLGPVVLEDLAASVMVRADGIEASLGRASLRGGTLKGRVALLSADPADPDETEVKAQGAFQDLDLGALMVDLGETSWVLGGTRGSFSLDGRGRDAESLVRRVAGRALLTVEGGMLTGLDLAEVMARGGAVPTGPLALRNNRTSFERAHAALAFSEGVGEIEDGALTGRSVTAALRGRVSLPERTFLARAALLPRRASAGEAAPLPAATLFELAGPWDAVAVRVRPREEGVRSEPIAVPPGPPTPVRAYAP